MLEDGWGSELLPGFNDLDDDALVTVDLVDIGVGDAHADCVKVHALVPGALLDGADLSLLLFSEKLYT